MKTIARVKEKTQGNSKRRARGYSRTSGEKQRDNTSIPRQKAEIEKFIAKNDEWEFTGHYVDECRSGAKIDGRDAFQQMMRDAAIGKFDVLVVYDITRFARDGSDIISETKVLKKNFGVDVIDTKGFDTRGHRNVMMNFVRAGMSQEERLRIMERNIGGRIEKAKNGLQWSGNPPAGRGFKRTVKNSGEWFITEEGHKISKLLERYADGEPLKALAAEYGFLCPSVILRNIHKSQLSGTYHARFHAPEIGVNNLEISVPAVPQIITPELEKRVKARLSQNQRWNKQAKRKYLLSGFVKCGQCGRALVALTNGKYFYYRHYANYTTTGKKCSFVKICGSVLETAVLDYLYSFFLDEPTYNEAVKNALPSDDDRKALANDIRGVERQLSQSAKKISNLANAVAGGIDVSLLLDKQNELKAEKQALEKRYDELNQTLAAMPNPKRIAQESMFLRIALVERYKNRNWRSLSYEEVRRFLHFLFGDNPIPIGRGQATGFGISVIQKNNEWHITFKGLAQFNHDVVNGRAVSHILQKAADRLNENIKRIYEEAVKEAEKDYERECKESRQPVESIKPFNDKHLSIINPPQADKSQIFNLFASPQSSSKS